MIPGIHEIEAGALEKLTDHESHKCYLGTIFSWADGDLDRRMPAGPTGRDFVDRYDAAIAMVAERANGIGDSGAVAVVSHGAAIRVWAGLRAGNIEPGFAAKHVLNNTGIVALEGAPDDGWELIHWDDSPVGGLALADPGAGDPTGRPA